MAMSSVEQDRRFHGFMGELEDLYCGTKNAEYLLERIEQAYENDELSTSQYDKLLRECEDFAER